MQRETMTQLDFDHHQGDLWQVLRRFLFPDGPDLGPLFSLGFRSVKVISPVWAGIIACLPSTHLYARFCARQDS